MRPLEASAFIVTVTVILLLRSRTHPDHCRAAALVIGARDRGGCLHRIGGIPRAGGRHLAVRTADRGRGDRDRNRYDEVSRSPTADRVMSVVEYAGGAAVIPLACATAGFFAAVRSLV